MIRAIRISADQGSQEVEPRPVPGALQWVDADETEPDAVFEIAERFGIGHATVDSILSDPDRPKLDTHGRYAHVALHSLGLDADQRIDTIQYDVIVGDSWILTFRSAAIPVIDWLWDEIERGDTFQVDSPAGLLALLSLYGTRRFAPVVDALAGQADLLGVDALTGTRGTLFEIQTLLRSEVVIRTTLRAQRGVMEQLAAEQAWVAATARERFADAADLHRALVDDLLTARTILSDAVNTYRGAVAERTGDVTRVLTIYAAVVLPMTLIAGIWGMNVDDLPFSTAGRGFVAVLAIMLVVGIGSTLLFIRVGYLTPPAPPDPKRLSSLLSGLVELPINVIRPAIRRMSGPDNRRRG